MAAGSRALLVTAPRLLNELFEEYLYTSLSCLETVPWSIKTTLVVWGSLLVAKDCNRALLSVKDHHGLLITCQSSRQGKTSSAYHQQDLLHAPYVSTFVSFCITYLF